MDAGAVRVPVLGVDVGGVLVDRVAEGDDTSFFGGRPMETPMVEGSLEAVRALAELFEYRIYIVSKAGPGIAELTRRWLGKHGFLRVIPASNVHFVRKRPEKHPVCERLGITHFVDDRLDVHEHLVTVDRRILFTGGLGRHEPPSDSPPGIVTIASWLAVVDYITETLE